MPAIKLGGGKGAARPPVRRRNIPKIGAARLSRNNPQGALGTAGRATGYGGGHRRTGILGGDPRAEARAAYQASLPAAGTGGTGGTATSGTTTAAEGGWYEYDYSPAGGNAPDWWKAMAHTDLGERESQLAQLNLMIPFMSPEDQRDAANTLYRELPEDFAHFAPDLTSFGESPGDLGKADRQQYLGQGRGGGILESIESLRTEVGKDVKDMGQGFTWLQQVSQLLKDYGATDERSITRGGYNKLLSGFKPLQEKAPEGFGLMGRMATMPFFSGDELMPTTTRMDGSQFFGKASKGLFF